MKVLVCGRCWRLRSGLVVSLAGVLLGSEAFPADTLEHDSIVEAVREQLTLLATIPKEFDADYRTYFPDGGDLTDENKRRSFKPGETINSAVTRLRQDGDRFFCTTEQHYWWPESESNPQTTWVAYDGKDEKRLTIGRTQKSGRIGNLAQGSVAVLETMSETGTFSRGWLLGYSLLDALDSPSATIEVDSHLSTIGTEDCYAIKIADGTATSTIWVSPAEGFNVKQWDIQFREKDYFSLNDIAPFRVFDIQCEQVGDVWFPVKAKLQHAHTPDDAPAEPLWVGELSLRNLKVNGKFTTADFGFDFPPGSDFRDARTDARFKVTDRGDVTPDLGFLREMPGVPRDAMTAISEEIDRQVAEVNRLARPDPQEQQPIRSNSRLPTRYVWLGAGIIGVGLGALLWRLRV